MMFLFWTKQSLYDITGFIGNMFIYEKNVIY